MVTQKSPLRCIFSSYGYGGFRGGIHLNVVLQMKSAPYPSIYETATQLTEKGGLALAYKVATLPAVRGVFPLLFLRSVMATKTEGRVAGLLSPLLQYGLSIK